MTIGAPFIAVMLALCPDTAALRERLQAQGFQLLAGQTFEAREVDAQATVAFLENGKLVESAVLGEKTCEARTETAVALIAAWSLALSQAAPKPTVRKAVLPSGEPTPSAPIEVRPRVMLEVSAAAWSKGLGGQAVARVGLRAAWFVASVGALGELAPTVAFGTGSVAWSTIAAMLGLGGETRAGAVTVLALAEPALGVSIVTGSGFARSSSDTVLELGLRAGVSVRWQSVPWQPGVMVSGMVWPWRQGAVVSNVSGAALPGVWSLSLGLFVVPFS